MPFPAFPSGLPLPLVAPVEGSAEPAGVRLQMESARFRQWLEYVDPVDRYELSWIFTDSQFLAFEAFIRDECDYGASAFAVSLDIGNGLAPSEFTVRLVEGQYAWTRTQRGFWSVKAQAEVGDADLFDETPFELTPVPDSDWILTTGIWDSAGIWRDEVWKSGP